MELRINWIKNHIKDGKYATLGEMCQAEQIHLDDTIDNAQANIKQIMKRSLALMSEIKQRFGILMALTPTTKAIYESYNAADQRALDEEIKDDNDAIAHRFIAGYLQERYGDVHHQLKENLKTERMNRFIRWIENPDNQELAWFQQWEAITKAWKEAEPEDKELFSLSARLQ